MKRFLFAAASGLSLIAAPVTALAQNSGEPSAQQLEAMGDMFAGMFTSEPLTDEQEARLPAAKALIDVMMPEGFYADMMSEMMSSTMGPLLDMMGGAGAAEMVIGSRVMVDPQVTASLSDAEKAELAGLLDPSFGERGTIMQDMLNDIMLEAAVLIEPGFKEGMAKAYAIRFDDAQLADIAAFFATPTGKLYAQENIKLMADPQVMSASMQAMPAMMQQFGDMGAQMEAAMAALPPERDVSDLSAEQRSRMAQILGVDEATLGDVVTPVAPVTIQGE
ncbi:DUF2059 domain-containing protein [Erythrobacter sp. SCSIO 43205]|uniref:DUF2059 domain-containing protein n=1 Tax=Erythrobacter sp. SCSIO 43205 TaxID=2779361 RepID=UPI001CAA0CC2|nr:DUF2059 domain-containing protein [Erythrobacter sp. SCSIO 43205]UAB78350.1 DUF2059 domain-containing protein [Erythrobacter sp. SCSIO 43205]